MSMNKKEEKLLVSKLNKDLLKMVIMSSENNVSTLAFMIKI